MVFAPSVGFLTPLRVISEGLKADVMRTLPASFCAASALPPYAASA